MLIPVYLRDNLNFLKYKLEEIEAHRYVLSGITQLDTKSTTKRFPCLKDCAIKSLITFYVIEMYKLFDRDKKSITIQKLIKSILEFNIKNYHVDNKLYVKFKKQAISYLNFAESVEKKLRKVRNKLYAHNTKKYKVKEKVNLTNTEAWLRKAIKIFNEIAILLEYEDKAIDIATIQGKLGIEISLLRNKFNAPR